MSDHPHLPALLCLPTQARHERAGRWLAVAAGGAVLLAGLSARRGSLSPQAAAAIMSSGAYLLGYGLGMKDNICPRAILLEGRDDDDRGGEGTPPEPRPRPPARSLIVEAAGLGLN